MKIEIMLNIFLFFFKEKKGNHNFYIFIRKKEFGDIDLVSEKMMMAIFFIILTAKTGSEGLIKRDL